MSDELELLLDGVWQRRRSELLVRVDELLADLDAARAGDPAGWASLGAHAHRMTGALGTLGFDGPAGVTVEVEDAVARESAPSPQRLDALEVQVRAVRQTLLEAVDRPR